MSRTSHDLRTRNDIRHGGCTCDLAVPRAHPATRILSLESQRDCKGCVNTFGRISRHFRRTTALRDCWNAHSRTQHLATLASLFSTAPAKPTDIANETKPRQKTRLSTLGAWSCDRLPREQVAAAAFQSTWAAVLN